jgi:hypothetical protein
VAIRSAGRLTTSVAVFALAAVACGGGAGGQAAPTTSCATLVPGADGSPSPTTTPCVLGATGDPTTSPGGTTASGEDWQGHADISSSAVYPNGDTCRDGWTLTFGFSVDADGKVHGAGTADLTSDPVCPFPITAGSWMHVNYNVLGDRSANAVDVHFAMVSYEPVTGVTWAGFHAVFGSPAVPEGGPPVTISIVDQGGHGQGSWQFESGNPAAVYSATGPVSIACTGCA